MFGTLGLIVIFSIMLAFRIIFGRATNRSLYRSSLVDTRYSIENERFAYTTTNSTENPIVAHVRKFIRRRKALKICSSYLRTINNIHILNNKHVIFKFDTKQKIFICKDKKNLKNSITVYWADQVESFKGEIDNIFEEVFDTICVSFNENSKYSKIEEVLSEFFDEVRIKTKEDVQTPKEPITVKKEPCLTINEYLDIGTEGKLNINTATEEELTNLPRINVVQAKRAIKYRDENGGYDSIEEFYNVLKIKIKYQGKLNDLICIKSQTEEASEQKENHRIIDF